MPHAEHLFTLEEEDIIPEVVSQGMMSGDNIYSFGSFISVQMAIANDGKNILVQYQAAHPLKT